MRSSLSIASLLTLATLGLSSAASANQPKQAVASVINNVRQSRDQKALAFLDGDAQGSFLMGGAWKKGTDAQRKEFVDLFHTLFAKIAFPKVRDDFKNLDSILYEQPKIEGDRAELGSVILINHPMKKQELKVRYQLNKAGADWKLVDVAVLGDSMLKGIRDDQIQPLFAEGGWEGVLKAMRDKAKELAGQPL